MQSRSTFFKIALAFSWPLVGSWLPVIGDDGPGPAFQIHLDPGHPWRPPFGLERIGRPVVVVIEAGARPDAASYVVTSFLKGKEGASYPLRFPAEAPFSARITLERHADLLVFSSDPKPGEKPVEIARQAIEIPEFEAESIAAAEPIINPVDLGSILVPSGWLLLGPGQMATLTTAAISRTQDWPRARISARFESAPAGASSAILPIRSGVRETARLQLPQAPPGRDRDVLSVGIDDGNGHELWHKNIPVMLVRSPPRRPRFGASYEKLRFDAPISVRDPATGKYSSLRYEDGRKLGLSLTSSSGCPTGRGLSSGSAARAISCSRPARNNTGSATNGPRSSPSLKAPSTASSR